MGFFWLVEVWKAAKRGSVARNHRHTGGGIKGMEHSWMVRMNSVG